MDVWRTMWTKDKMVKLLYTIQDLISYNEKKLWSALTVEMLMNEVV